jgi:hypothetical protein
MASHFPPGRLIGAEAAVHTHWVFPLLCEHRAETICHLRDAGFDARFKASSIASELENSPLNQALQKTIFLPNYASMPNPEVTRLCKTAQSTIPAK